MGKTLINILGAGRSGTTMLDLMLGNDDKSFSLGEVHAWFRPFRKHHFSIDCNCGKPDCDVWQKIKSFDESKFHISVFDTLNIEYLVDSSKNLRWVIDNNLWARRGNLRVINLCIYKMPIEYIYSIWKRNRNAESIARALRGYKLYYSRLIQTGLVFSTISFKDLVSETDRTLSLICNITGQCNFPTRKEFWNKHSHHLFGSGGVRLQSRQGASDIHAEEVYPDAFVTLLPAIREKMGHDHELQSILTELERRDISLGLDQTNSTTAVHKPIWYYLAWLKGAWRSQFPEQSPPAF